MTRQDGRGEGGRLALMSRWPATIFVAVVIVVLSELPARTFPSDPLIPHADKIVHFIEYLVLGLLLFRSLCHELSGNLRLAGIMTVLAGTLFGLGGEWRQSYVGRTADVWDLAADVAGLVCGVVCIIAAGRWRRKHVE
jgi:VanZ family protein